MKQLKLKQKNAKTTVKNFDQIKQKKNAANKINIKNFNIIFKLII